MVITPLQIDILIRMADPARQVPVQHSNYPSEPSYRVELALEELHLNGYITARKSVAESHWIAMEITAKGIALLEEAGLK